MVQLLSMTVLAGVAMALPAARTLRQPIFVDIETTATAPSASPTNTPLYSILASWPQVESVSIPKEPKIIVPPTTWPETTKQAEYSIMPPNPIKQPSTTRELVVGDTHETTSASDSTTPIVVDTTAIAADTMTILKEVESSMTPLLPWQSATQELLRDFTTLNGLLKTMSNTAKPTTTKPVWQSATQRLLETLYSSAPTEVPSWVVGTPVPTNTAPDQDLFSRRPEEKTMTPTK